MLGWALTFLVVALVAGVLGFTTVAGAAIGIAKFLFWVFLILFVVSLVMLGHRYWSWYAQDYLVTNRRVLKVEGILNKRSADSSLEKINDAVLEQNLVGRIFGYGDLDIMTASEESVDRCRMLDQAPRFKKVMLDQKHQLEADMVRLPSPPARSSATASSSRRIVSVPRGGRLIRLPPA